MAQDNMEIAYWRDENDYNCIFAFLLNYKRDKLEILQEIVAVININATVNDLLHHIKKKVNHYIKEACNKLEINFDDYQELNLSIILKSNSDVINVKDTCKNVLKLYHNLFFIIFEQEFLVKLNAPLVKYLKLPDIIFLDTEIFPAKYKFLWVDKKRSDFLWYRSKDKNQWQLIDNGWEHKVSNRDVGFYLKVLCKPANLIHVGPECEAISKHVVFELPDMPKCPFEDRQQYTRKFLNKNNFRIMSYNILSDRYCKQDTYEYCPVPYLAINYRKKLLIKEILGYHADIICLQEVDEYVLKNDYSKALSENYTFSFNRKGNGSTEGLLMAYRHNKFDCLFKRHIIFGRTLLYNWEFQKLENKLQRTNMDVYNELIKLGTSLQIMCLNFRNTQRVLLIATTHLYYHPECDHLRLLQLQIAFMYIERVVIPQFKRKYPNMQIMVIFCGDFNSNPDRDTYKFITNSIVNTGPTVKKISKNGHKVKHSFQFKSAYGTPEFTNYTGDFKGCLDYIFYEHKHLILAKIVPLPEESVLSENTALPSSCFPSDHLALIADFNFK